MKKHKFYKYIGGKKHNEYIVFGRKKKNQIMFEGVVIYDPEMIFIPGEVVELEEIEFKKIKNPFE